MIRGILSLSALVSVILFPWPFTALLAVGTAFLEPLIPLSVGLFADTLYYAPHAGSMPLFTLYGAMVTAAVLFVRSRLLTGPVR